MSPLASGDYLAGTCPDVADGGVAALSLPLGQPHRRHVALALVVAVQGRDLGR